MSTTPATTTPTSTSTTPISSEPLPNPRALDNIRRELCAIPASVSTREREQRTNKVAVKVSSAFCDTDMFRKLTCRTKSHHVLTIWVSLVQFEAMANARDVGNAAETYLKRVPYHIERNAISDMSSYVQNACTPDGQVRFGDIGTEAKLNTTNGTNQRDIKPLHVAWIVVLTHHGHSLCLAKHLLTARQYTDNELAPPKVDTVARLLHSIKGYPEKQVVEQIKAWVHQDEAAASASLQRYPNAIPIDIQCNVKALQNHMSRRLRGCYCCGRMD